jgi:hypothetical protein
VSRSFVFEAVNTRCSNGAAEQMSGGLTKWTSCAPVKSSAHAGPFREFSSDQAEAITRAIAQGIAVGRKPGMELAYAPND